MTRLATTPAILGIFVSGLVAAGLPAGCGSNKVEIGLQNIDAQAPGLDAPAGSGGVGGTGSTATAGGNTAGGGVTATGGSTPIGGTAAGGGATGAGGATKTGGVTTTGGSTPTGGTTRTGGATGAGGTTGTGGATASGGTGGTGKTCGGLAGLPCAAGEVCDMPAGSCNVADGFGTCVPGPQVYCSASYQPVCGCDGRTYSGDCLRLAAGVTKKSDGACPTTDAAAGGSTRTGGGTGTGGVTGTGGTGGSTGKTCGGIAGVLCSTGQFCELPAASCNVGDATGTCVANAGLGCIAIYQPVCGCDGKTYPSDCDRRSAGVSKKADGACPTADAGVTDAGTRYATAWLAWQAPGGVAGTGPAVVVGGAGWADTWTRVNGFSPETPPSSATGTYTLTTAVVDDLFARLASVNFSQLPHPGTGWECYPRLYFRLCAGCTATTLNYDVPSELLPEMEPVWAWFDQLLTATDYANPRTYCELPAATLCTASGGQVSSALCCNSAADFPNSCLTGACGCAPSSSHTVSTCNCAAGCFMPAYGCVGPAGTCTVGADQTCNDNPAISSLHGRCVDDGRCVCGPGALLASGKCQ